MRARRLRAAGRTFAARTNEVRRLIPEIVDAIRREYQPERIVLFGSYAYGHPTRDSDVDLLIVKDTDKRRVDRFVEVSRTLFRLAPGIPVEPHIYTPDELRERLSLGDPFIKEILRKGVKLYDRADAADAGVVSKG